MHMFQIHEFNFQHNLKIGRLKIRDNYIFSALEHYLESFHYGLDLVHLQFIQLAIGNAAPEDDDPLRSALFGFLILVQAGCRFKKKTNRIFKSMKAPNSSKRSQLKFIWKSSSETCELWKLKIKRKIEIWGKRNNWNSVCYIHDICKIDFKISIKCHSLGKCLIIEKREYATFIKKFQSNWRWFGKVDQKLLKMKVQMAKTKM